MTKAIFLDRDGTINEEVSYLRRKEDIKIFPDAADVLHKFRKMGFLNIIITNQSGIARGFLTEEDLAGIHEEILKRLMIDNTPLIDEIYFSPYLAEGLVKEYSIESDERKPGTGMIRRAQDAYEINIKESFLIGDSFTDMQCAQKAGLKKILVETGYGKRDYAKCIEENIAPDYFAKNLLDACSYIESITIAKSLTGFNEFKM